LANDFYDFFDRQMQWNARKPLTPHGFEIDPGIQVATVIDNVPTSSIKNIKERSGALLL
jgi:hypothetical protein